MAKIRRVDFSPDEWLAGTRDLTLEERGAYWDICALMYSRGGPVADEEAWMARTLGCDVRRWRRIRARLIELGKLRESVFDGRNCLTNSRAQREIAKATDRIDTAHRAAEASARSRQSRAEVAPKYEGSTSEVGAKSSGSPADNQDDLLDNNGLAEAGATPPSLSQPSTTNHHSRESLTVTSGARADGAAPAQNERKATRLPEDWRPEGELRQWTIDEIRKAESGVSAGHELERFRDYWRAQPGAKGRKLDWNATWRNWIRKAIEMEGRPNGAQRSHQPQARRGSAVRTAANFAAALGGDGLGGSGGNRWEPDTERMGTADPYDPSGKARGGA